MAQPFQILSISANIYDFSVRDPNNPDDPDDPVVKFQENNYCDSEQALLTQHSGHLH